MHADIGIAVAIAIAIGFRPRAFAICYFQETIAIAMAIPIPTPSRGPDFAIPLLNKVRFSATFEAYIDLQMGEKSVGAQGSSKGVSPIRFS